MHVSRICGVLACIGDRLNIIMNLVGAVIVKFVVASLGILFSNERLKTPISNGISNSLRCLMKIDERLTVSRLSTEAPA